jgi:hypothetical protein
MKTKTLVLMAGMIAVAAFAEDTPPSTWIQGKLRVGPDNADNSLDPTNSGGGTAVAIGSNTLASGASSVAIGTSSEATNNDTIALGYTNVASGYRAVVLGSQATAAGDFSAALGKSSSVSSGSTYGTAIGNSSEVTALGASAIGYDTTASGSYGMAFGYKSSVTGDYATTLGPNVTAASYASVVIGRYNQPTGATAASWIATEPLFVIGNGTSSTATSNAVVVLKNGNTGFGVNAPAEKLEVNGTVKATGIIKAGGGVLVPQQGDILMGSFTAGPTP